MYAEKEGRENKLLGDDESTFVVKLRGLSKKREKEREKTKKRFGSTVGKGYYHHAGGPKSMSSGGRRHNGSHNGHHGSGAGTAVEHNGHHPPREPRKEENTLVRRSFRRCGDEWRSDSRRCVFFHRRSRARPLFLFSLPHWFYKRVTGTRTVRREYLFIYSRRDRASPEISDCTSLSISQVAIFDLQHENNVSVICQVYARKYCDRNNNNFLFKSKKLW